MKLFYWMLLLISLFLVSCTNSTETDVCDSNWVCSNWTSCSSNNLQSRNCVDMNFCSMKDKPSESKSCEYEYKPQFIVDLKENNTYNIVINGSKDCQKKVQSALDLIESEAPEYYYNVTKYIGIIECTHDGSGIHVRHYPPTFVVGERTWNNSIIWLAGTIVHDAHHSKQFWDFAENNPGVQIPREVYTGQDAEIDSLEIQYAFLEKIGADKGTLILINSSKNSNYWNISEKDRWW